MLNDISLFSFFLPLSKVNIFLIATIVCHAVADCLVWLKGKEKESKENYSLLIHISFGRTKTKLIEYHVM